LLAAILLPGARGQVATGLVRTGRLIWLSTHDRLLPPGHHGVKRLRDEPEMRRKLPAKAFSGLSGP